MSTALDEIAAERARQISAEGWTSEHDDEHSRGELALAGATYAAFSVHGGTVHDAKCFALWPFAEPPKLGFGDAAGIRRRLIKAAALIVAEIERLDRAAEQADIQKEQA